MKTFSINTLGCKVNQYESQQIRQFLEQLGLNQLGTSEPSDLVIINTCCVTRTASAKSRQYIRKAQKLSSASAVVICGCLPCVQTGELNDFGEKNVHIVKDRRNLTATLSQIVRTCRNTAIKTENAGKIKCKNNSASGLDFSPLNSFKDHTRAFLKVQDGCDGYCSYCIIPSARPIVHSKPAETVIQEAQTLVEAGHREIVVTGIFLGAFGQKSVRRKTWPNQTNDKLAELLDKMAQIPKLARIRLSSLEPADVTARLLDTFCKHPNIMPHIHLSLQSGSNAVLEKMRRQYSVEEFIEKVKLIKSRLDRPAITADIIVGFPGETDSDFEQTAELARQTGFAKMHVFGFSSRKGTTAARMAEGINDRVIKSRSKILRRLDAELGRKFRRQFIGETTTILLENDGVLPGGRTERYFMVYLEKAAKSLRKNELVKVKLIRNTENGLIGRAV